MKIEYIIIIFVIAFIIYKSKKTVSVNSVDAIETQYNVCLDRASRGEVNILKCNYFNRT